MVAFNRRWPFGTVIEINRWVDEQLPGASGKVQPHARG
jgi:hypothetical protein